MLGKNSRTTWTHEACLGHSVGPRIYFCEINLNPLKEEQILYQSEGDEDDSVYSQEMDSDDDTKPVVISHRKAFILGKSDFTFGIC